MQTIKPKLCQHLRYLSKQSLNKIATHPLDQTCSLHQNNQMYYICLHCGVSCCLGQQQNMNCIELHFKQTQFHYFALEIDLGTIWCYECKDSIQNMLFAYDKNEKDQQFNKLNRFATFIGEIWKQISTKMVNNKQTKVIRGLKNLGNTCFLNVVLQTIHFTTPLKKLYEKYQRTETKLKYNSRFINKEVEMFYDDMLQKKKSQEWNVVRDKKRNANKHQQLKKKRELKSPLFNFLLQDFLREMDLLKQAAYKPLRILDFLGEINTKYTLNQEQDAQQLFLTILDLLSEGERFSLLNDKERYTQIEKLLGFQKLVPIQSLFGFYLLNQIQCNQCKQITHNINLTYTLPITPQSSLSEDYRIQHKDKKIDIDYWQDLFYPNEVNSNNFLQHFFKVQKLSLSQNFYSCSKCKSIVAYRKYYMIDQPQILVISLKRFNSQLQKNSKYIAFPSSLELAAYCTSPGETRYNLYGVIVHQGRGISTGHYLCFVKCENRWFLCSDHKIQIVEEKYVLNQQAYILFYQKVQSDV